MRCSYFVPTRRSNPTLNPLTLWNSRTGSRRDSADSRCAGWERRSRDKEVISLRRSRTTLHAYTRKGIDVWVTSRETIRECHQKRNDLVLLLIRQAELAGRHVEIVPDLGHRPAVYFFDRSCRAVPGSDVECNALYVARIVEVDELLQALDVAVVKELLLEVRPWRLGGGTLWRRQSNIARRRHLHLAVNTRSKLCPVRVRVGPGAEAASEESSQSQISVPEA